MCWNHEVCKIIDGLTPELVDLSGYTSSQIEAGDIRPVRITRNTEFDFLVIKPPNKFRVPS